MCPFDLAATTFGDLEPTTEVIFFVDRPYSSNYALPDSTALLACDGDAQTPIICNVSHQQPRLRLNSNSLVHNYLIQIERFSLPGTCSQDQGCRAETFFKTPTPAPTLEFLTQKLRLRLWMRISPELLHCKNYKLWYFIP